MARRVKRRNNNHTSKQYSKQAFIAGMMQAFDLSGSSSVETISSLGSQVHRLNSDEWSINELDDVVGGSQAHKLKTNDEETLSNTWNKVGLYISHAIEQYENYYVKQKSN